MIPMITNANTAIIIKAPLSHEYSGMFNEVMIYQLEFIKINWINPIAV